MAEVRNDKNESLDAALKHFKKACARDGMIAEVRKRENYEKPSVRRKRRRELENDVYMRDLIMKRKAKRK